MEELVSKYKQYIFGYFFTTPHISTFFWYLKKKRLKLLNHQSIWLFFHPPMKFLHNVNHSSEINRLGNPTLKFNISIRTLSTLFSVFLSILAIFTKCILRVLTKSPPEKPVVHSLAQPYKQLWRSVSAFCRSKRHCIRNRFQWNTSVTNLNLRRIAVSVLPSCQTLLSICGRRQQAAGLCWCSHLSDRSGCET